MATTHIISTSTTQPVNITIHNTTTGKSNMSSSATPSGAPNAGSSSNVVGVHYKVGKKIGEGSFGVIFEGTNLLNSQTVAIKFVSVVPWKMTRGGGGLLCTVY